MGRAILTVFAIAALAAAGCQRVKGLPAPNASASPPPPATASALPAFNETPLGNPPGGAIPGVQVRNPLEGNAAAVAEGKALFGAMNCVYCHNANGAGLIGPSLQGPSWRFGGAPIQLYASVHDGRPKGMPAFGQRLPPQEIWKVVAYLESLGGAASPATADTPPAAPSVTGNQVFGQKSGDAARRAQAAADASKS